MLVVIECCTGGVFLVTDGLIVLFLLLPLALCGLGFALVWCSSDCCVAFVSECRVLWFAAVCALFGLLSVWVA